MPDRSPSLLVRKALARWENKGGARAHVDTVLPRPVLDLAKRSGVENGSSARRVTLTQSGDMRLGKGTRRSRFHARQTIEVAETGFEWRASFGPFDAISVTDAYRDGAGSLDVRVFGFISLAHMNGPAFAKGEIMRYLTEIALVPDAILQNRSLLWTVLDDRTLNVAAGSGAGYGCVRMEFSRPTGRTVMARSSRSGRGPGAFSTTAAMRVAGCRSGPRSAGRLMGKSWFIGAAR